MSNIVDFPGQSQGTVVFQIFKSPVPGFYVTILLWPGKPEEKPQLTDPEEIPSLVNELAGSVKYPLEFEVHDFSTEIEYSPAHNDNRPPEHA